MRGKEADIVLCPQSAEYDQKRRGIRSAGKSDKIKYLSVAHMFADAIERIYSEMSVSKLFS